MSQMIQAGRRRSAGRMSEATVGLIAATILLAGPPRAGAQANAAPAAQGAVSPPAGMARLWITAMEKGRPASDLKKEDLRLFIGKQEQTISSLTFNPPAPLGVVLLVDTSGSRRSGWPGPELSLASGFFRQILRPGDQAYVADFGVTGYTDYVDAGPTDQPVALDDGLRKLAALRPYGGTALYDAIEGACKLPQGGRIVHRALVIVTDGDDNASNHRLDQALDAARRTNTALYFLGRPVASTAAPSRLAVMTATRHFGKQMRKAAEATGGLLFEVKDKADVQGAFNSIAEILHAQYALEFQPTAPRSGKKNRRVKIKCTRRGVKVVAPEEY